MGVCNGLKNAIRIAALSGCALALLLAGCGSPPRDVTSANPLLNGTVPCASTEPTANGRHRQLLWVSHDAKKGCEITISYHGTEQCGAYLEYVTTRRPLSFGGFPGATNTPTMTNYWAPPTPPATTRHAGTTNATVTLRDATAVWVVCGDLEHPHEEGGCSFTIDAIDCSRDAELLYLTRTNVTVLSSTNVPCGSAKQVVWTAPLVNSKPGVCTVTVVLHGSANCFASLWAADAQGNSKGMEFAGAESRCVTFQNINQLSLSCSGTGGATGGCSVDIIQTECDK